MIDKFIGFLRLFKDIPDADAAVIRNEISTREAKEGTVLFVKGAVCREMYFICQGVLRVVSANEKGNPVTHFFLKENQFCSILNSFNNGVTATESIEAACDVELIVLKRQKLDKLFERLPYLKELITGITTQALLEKIRVRNAYLGEDASTRYRNFLMIQPEIAMRVSLADIASYLGVTQQSLSRIRKNIR